MRNMSQLNAVDADTAAHSQRRAHALLGLKVLVGLAIIAAPALIAAQFVTGVTGVALYGVLAAAFGWIAGGPKVGAGVVTALAVLGVTAVALGDQTWLLAVLLIALGAAYGYAASRGVGEAVLQLPILTPYFIMKPPVLLTDPPVVGPAYALGIMGVMIAMGLWTILILHLAVGKRSLKRIEVRDRRMPLVYGVVLGVISAGVMVAGTTIGLKSHWVWITLTLYLLADPTQLFGSKKMIGRAIGTAVGFAGVALLIVLGIPDEVLLLLAFPALWLCLFFMLIKKPYWQYTMFLTITVVLLNSKEIDTLLLDAERFGFTVFGAVLSIVAAAVVNLVYYRRVGLTAERHNRAPSDVR